MKWLLLLICFWMARNASAAEMKPGLMARASDGELTVYFIAATANIAVEGKESIHPQLKPAFKAQFTGYLHIDKAGPYTIYGPTNLMLDGKFCVGQKVTLPAGDRALRLDVARKKTESVRVQIEWESDDFPRQLIPASVFTHDRTPRELRENESRDMGRELFENLSCTACHGETALPYAQILEITNAVKSLPIASLQPTQGCLADTPQPPSPIFRLTRPQREALQLFIQTPDISFAPAIDFARELRQFHCADCHSGQFQMAPADFGAALKSHRDAELFFPNGKSEEFMASLIRNYSRSRP